MPGERAEMMDPLAVVPLSEVLKRTGFSRTTLYRSMAAAKFPKPLPPPFRVGREPCWREKAIVDFLDNLQESA